MSVVIKDYVRLKTPSNAPDPRAPNAAPTGSNATNEKKYANLKLIHLLLIYCYQKLIGEH